MIFVLALSLGSLVWAGALYRRGAHREPFYRWTYALFPPLILTLLFETVGGVLLSPTLSWNEIRISRSAALIRGFTIYPGKNALGPIIGTLHAPVSHCFYLLTAWMATPTAMIVASSAISVLAVFLALVWVARRRGGQATLPFLFCAFLILQMPGTYATVLLVHTDAAALACLTVACGILCGTSALFTRSQLWIAGAACALVIGCKQTLAPVSLGLLLFIAVVSGWRDAIRFLIALVATGCGLLLAIAAFIPLSAFLFNTVALAAHRPLQPGYLALLSESLRQARLEALPAVFPIGALLVDKWLVRNSGFRFKHLVDENRWLVFVLAGLCVFPVSAKAAITVGGDVNHLGLVLYALFVGATLAIQQNLDSARDFPRVTARLSAVIGIVACIAPASAINIPNHLRHLTESASEQAFRYAAKHGTETYFPRNPTAALLANGKLYHFDVALFDREIAGAPLTPEQVQSGLPAGFRRIAMPPEQPIYSKALNDTIAGWPVTSDAELPGWTIYERKR